MADLYTSHATIGSSTLRNFPLADMTMPPINDLTDLTSDLSGNIFPPKHPNNLSETSIPGPEDFTIDFFANINKQPVNALPSRTSSTRSSSSKRSSQSSSRDKPSPPKLRTRRPLDTNQSTTSSIGGPPDFTQNIIHHATTKPSSRAHSLQPTVSDPSPADNTIPLQASTTRRPQLPNRTSPPHLADPPVALSPPRLPSEIEDFTAPVAESTPERSHSSSSTELTILRNQLQEMRALLSARDATITALQASLSAEKSKTAALETATAQHAMREAAAQETAARAEGVAKRQQLLKDAVVMAEEEASRARQDAQQAREEVDRAREGAVRTRGEQEARERVWEERAEVLLKEVERRGRAVLRLLGERECVGVRDREGRQGYRYAYHERKVKGRADAFGGRPKYERAVESGVAKF